MLQLVDDIDTVSFYYSDTMDEEEGISFVQTGSILHLSAIRYVASELVECDEGATGDINNHDHVQCIHV